jgi:hypothetical protein
MKSQGCEAQGRGRGERRTDRGLVLELKNSSFDACWQDMCQDSRTQIES